MSDSNTTTYAALHPSTPSNRIVIIGAGIVGSALAKHLSALTPLPIVVVDASLTALLGSTGHAPGFVGQLNELPVLTTLAKASVAEYQSLPGDAFATVGGLEIASTPAGTALLQRRHQLAQAAALPAQLIDSAAAAALAPHLHNAQTPATALHFPSDGTANAAAIVAAYRGAARAAGVVFLEAAVSAITTDAGRTTGIATSLGPLPAARVVVATGIWTAQLLASTISLPIVPVAHAYVYGPARAPRSRPSPFVRWPERHVYARDHGERDGFGSYDHAAMAVDAAPVGGTAIAEWDARLDGVVAQALAGFPELMGKEEMEPFNGVFSVTPDGLPLAGPVGGVEGLWVAAAVWVTHAAGVARFVADLMVGNEVEEEVRGGLDPGRFGGRGEEELRREALGTYNNIYNALE